MQSGAAGVLRQHGKRKGKEAKGIEKNENDTTTICGCEN